MRFGLDILALWLNYKLRPTTFAHRAIVGQLLMRGIRLDAKSIIGLTLVAREGVRIGRLMKAAGQPGLQSYLQALEGQIARVEIALRGDHLNEYQRADANEIRAALSLPAHPDTACKAPQSQKRIDAAQLAAMPPEQAYDVLLTLPADERKRLLLEMDHKLHSAMTAQALVRNLNARTAELPGDKY